MSALALGTWGLSGDGYGNIADLEKDRVIERARACGITLFETADCYERGKMETRLGERLGSDEKCLFCTKIGTDLAGDLPTKRFEASYLDEALSRSAERLKRETIDIVLLHNPSAKTVERAEAVEFLKEQKAKGRLKSWGISAGSVEVAQAALDAEADVISITYNVFHQEVHSAIEATAKRTETGVLAHSVLGYGLLAGQWSQYRTFRGDDHRSKRWTPTELKRRVRQLDALRPAVSGATPTLRSAAVGFALTSPTISSVILGPRASLQLDQLIREMADGPPYYTEGKLTALKNRLKEVGIEE